MLKDLVKKNRSYRRFDESQTIDHSILIDMVDTARICSSAANRQGLRYKVISEKSECAKVFKTLGWAGYLNDWNGPVEGEKPTAYIIMLRDKSVTDAISFDDGISAQAITLLAAENGYGACILMNCKWKELFESLDISEDKYAFSCVIALGIAAEEVILETMVDGNIKYYRDENDVHHVPKHSLEDILL